MLCHGSVRAPTDAKVGPAIVRVEMPESSRWNAFPTEIPVLIKE